MELKNHHPSRWMFAEGSPIVSKPLPIRCLRFTKRDTLSAEKAGPPHLPRAIGFASSVTGRIRGMSPLVECPEKVHSATSGVFLPVRAELLHPAPPIHMSKP